MTLIVEPGNRPGPTEPIPVGVPYGTRARLILIYLQTEALRTKSREIELGGSMRDWLRRMGISYGGKSQALIRDQAERISRCRLSFNIQTKVPGAKPFKNQNIVDEAIFLDYVDGQQRSLFVEVARLSETFFAQLQRHPVPLEEAAVRAISNNSLALDLYAWLAYRLHALKKPTPVNWPALKGQFGNGFQSTRNFRPTFIDNLRLALAVYREARVDVTDLGVELYPSRPPVAPRQFAAAGKVPTPAAANSPPISGPAATAPPPIKRPANRPPHEPTNCSRS